MTTSLDVKLVPRVVSLLNKLGKTITLTRELAGAYDPLTLTTTPTGTQVQTVKITPPEAYSDFYVNNTTIQAGDFRCFMSTDLTWVPKQNDIAEFDGLTFRIIKIQPVFSGDNIVLYGMQLRA